MRTEARLAVLTVATGAVATAMLGFGYGIWLRAVITGVPFDLDAERAAAARPFSSLARTAEITRELIATSFILYALCTLSAVRAAVRHRATALSWPWLELLAIPLVWIGVGSTALSWFGSHVSQEGLLVATVGSILSGFGLWQRVVRSTSTAMALTSLCFGIVGVVVPVVLSALGRT